ncbi:MAG: DUF445 domain-containing protein [Lutispora sp.]|jgi:uncharacterized membrane protein YheB (UPF0754 family)|uniref:DUF445 domain-containing protein n=1 Tax=Lutispora sp. TaxID=2828727 RepID=UPI003569B25A
MYKVLISTIIGGIIGWLTNIIAIKMLFRPIKPVKILALEIQGLIPKRKAEMAVSIGQTVEMELIDFKDIFERIIDEGSSDRIIELVKRKISQNIYEKLPSLVPHIIKNAVIQYVEEQIDKEAPQMIEDLIKNIYDKASKEVKIGKIIEERINSFDLIKIEEITLKIAQKELKHIEILGGVLGAIIGLLQGLLLLLYI